MRGAVEGDTHGRTQPELEWRVAGHVRGRVEAAAVFGLLEARVDLVARNGLG